MPDNDDFAAKKLNPRGSYHHPDEVLAGKSLTREQKIEILLEWRYDAIRLQQSADENMAGGERDMLREVSNALLQLDVAPSAEAAARAGTPEAYWQGVKRRFSKAFGPTPGAPDKSR